MSLKILSKDETKVVELYPGLQDALMLIRDHYERFLTEPLTAAEQKTLVKRHTFKSWLRYHSYHIARWDEVFSDDRRDE